MIGSPATNDETDVTHWEVHVKAPSPRKTRAGSVSRLALLIVVMVLANPLSQSQTQSQSAQDYDAHLAKLQKSIADWQAQIEAVDPAKIEVSYQTGKLLEDTKTILLKNLLTISVTTAAIREQRQLSLEINLYSSLAGLHSNMDSLSDLLFYTVASDQKPATAWAQTIGAIANGSLNDEEEYQIDAVVKSADALERRCGTNHSPARK
jgi:hypothetical protein